jgi:hypothetical protein
MTATYDKLGVKFLYPENWKLIDETGEPHVISLETPDGSTTWTVHVYPAETDQAPILKETLATLQESYEDCEVAASNDELGEYQATGVEAMFYCLDFLIKAKIQFVETKDHLLMFWLQAEDRDFDKQEIVFKAISVSLLQSMKQA